MVALFNTMIRRMKHVFLTLLYSMSALMYSVSASANTVVEASIDRSEIYMSDTINLTITSSVELDGILSGIFNLSAGGGDTPDTRILEKDFEILDQNQSQNARVVNGKGMRQITWNYALAPKHSGTIVIPSLKVGDGETSALTLKVIPGKAPIDNQRPPIAFIEVEVDSDQVYVQQQATYKIRLFLSGQLAGGDLSEPTAEDAIIEGVGDTKKYFRMAYNQRYEVRERQYLVFPQKSGVLEISPIQFNGTIIDTRQRSRKRVREVSDPLTLNVIPPPSKFSGDLWLPASAFELSENWSTSPDTINVGDSITRTINIRALGLLGSALPPVKMAPTDGLKLYPDQPNTESRQHSGGVESLRSETTAIVAIQPGLITLPEISIPWWDVVNDVERVAVIPERTIEIIPLSATPNVSSGIDTSSDISTENQNLLPEQSSQASVTETSDGESSEAVSSNHHGWISLIVLILIAWAATSWMLWKRGNRMLEQIPASDLKTSLNQTEVMKAIKDKKAEMTTLVISLINETRYYPNHIKSIADLDLYEPKIAEQLREFERVHYSNNRQETFDSSELLSLIKNLKDNDRQLEKTDRQELLPLYP